VEIILATTNPAKFAMLARVVSHEIRIRPLPESLACRPIPDSVESAATIEEIAEAKSVFWSLQLPGRLVAATDGGLLIPALGDRWDPARTARFAGLGCTNADRIAALLRLTGGLSGEQRRIRWREAMAIAVDGQVVAGWRADSPDGLLAETAPADLRDSSTGFWVPHVWLCPEYGNRPLSLQTEEEQAIRADHWTTLGSHLAAWCGNPTQKL
jgi:inosine/xanthosine triphosphate pyrophosphatase family protein